MDKIRTLLPRHLPGYEVRSIVKRGEGLDNAAYEVNGELIVRASKETNPAIRSESTQCEALLLAVVAGLSTLPVPEPLFVEAEAGLLTCVKLPGVPLMDYPLSEPARLAPALGEFLSRLHLAPLEQVEPLVEQDAYPLLTWREDAQRDYREIVEHIPEAARPLVEDFCHTDLGAEHVLVDIEANTITGIIDWSDAAITDSARDLALIYRDLGPEIFELMLAHYEGHIDETDRERAVFYARCKLLEDIAYGVRTGARPYAEAGLAHLARTFEEFA